MASFPTACALLSNFWLGMTRHIFSKSAALHLLPPLLELFQEGKRERERVVSIPHLWILCSKMKLNHPCILNAAQRLNAQSGAVWASFHKSHGTCCAIRELLSTETFQKFQPASEQAECLRDDVLFVQNLQTVVSFPSADIGAARRPEVGALKPSLWEENQ